MLVGHVKTSATYVFHPSCSSHCLLSKNWDGPQKESTPLGQSPSLSSMCISASNWLHSPLVIGVQVISHLIGRMFLPLVVGDPAATGFMLIITSLSPGTKTSGRRVSPMIVRPRHSQPRTGDTRPHVDDVRNCIPERCQVN